MSYERDLAFNLRMRGLSENEIADTLDEIRAHGAATGTQAEEEFGTPQEYAQQFPEKKSRRTPGATVVLMGAVLAIIYVAVAMLLLPLLRVDIRDIVGPIRLWPALVVMLAGMLTGCLTDYFRPLPRSNATR